MKKSDIKTGMLVQLGNGKWYVAQIDTNSFFGEEGSILINMKTGMFYNLREIRNELECIYPRQREHCIVKIAEVNYLGDIFNAYKKGQPVQAISGFRVIWERKEGGQGNEKE